MKILALGNSFSEDCTAYLEEMTEGAYVRNLYIGGCSLARHAKNLEEKIADYELQRNAKMIAKTYVTANEVIASETWDVITVQQVSGCSGLYETHGKELDTVLSYLRRLCPCARIVWNQTWAYASYSTHGDFQRYGNNSEKMWRAIEDVSHRVARERGLEMIEVGRAIRHLREVLPEDKTELCRDGFHLSMELGRYSAAYVWANYFGLAVNGFIPSGADPDKIAFVRSVLDEFLKR